MLDLTLAVDEEQFLALVRDRLGARAANRFRAALAKPSTLLVDRVLRPHLFRCEPGKDIDEAIYFPIATTTKTPGRNHELAQSVATAERPSTPAGPGSWDLLAYFANALRACRPDWDEAEGREVWQEPSKRVALAPYHIFTYEHDERSIDFLSEQVSWVMSRRKSSDCPMGRLFTRLSEHPDFVGLTCNYGGNKSLHVHLTFDTRLAVEALDLSAIADLRPGLIEHWKVLRPVVSEVLGVRQGVEADPMLRLPESYRRTPNALRLVEADDHILGVRPGTWVRQVTLWEDWRERAARGATALFFRPGLFHTAPAATRERTRRPRASISSTISVGVTAEQVTFAEQKLRAHFGEWPKLDRLVHERGRWVARFFNSPHDRNAASILREDHTNILFAGTGADHLHSRPLLFPLGHMIRFWIAQHERLRRDEDEAPVEETVILPRPSASAAEHPLEVAFREAAHDPGLARAAARAFFLGAVPAHQLLWVSGPEGAGKSSALFAEHHRIVERIERPGGPSLALYGFGDYKTAQEKCDAFNEAQRGSGFVGVVLPSFSEAYARKCRELGLTAMSQAEAARRGYGSLWSAVKAAQPQIVEAFRAMHAAIWAKIGDARMVGFTVHQVLQGWDRQSPTRAMWSHSFWDGACDEAERRGRALRETALGLAVHDEVRVESVIEMQPLAVIEWVRRLSDRHEAARGRAGLDRQHAAWEAFVAQEGKPVIGSEAIDLSFDEFRRLAAVADGPWTRVTTRNSGEYMVEKEAEVGADGDLPDIYAARHGRPWAIQPRLWWQGLAPHVVVLTTEALPTAVARRADPSWSVFELDAPSLPHCDVMVHAIRGVTARNLARLCEEWRQRLGLPDAWVVSNRAADLPRSMTHARARGSNDLIGESIIQTMAFMSPDEYERVQTLNAWMGRSDACLLRHIDECNQTAGRNLGFRGREGVQHHLLINPRLLGLLLEGGLWRSRYEMVLHLDRGQRYRMKVG